MHKLWVAGYLWLCRFATQLGPYGIKPAYTRAPYTSNQKYLIKCALSIFVITFPVEFMNDSILKSFLSLLNVTAFSLAFSILFFGRPPIDRID